MIVTEDIIERGKSRNGGWGLAQLKCFGIKSFYKGWKNDVVGKEFPDKKVELFLLLRNRHLDYDPNEGWEAFWDRNKPRHEP